MANKCENCRHWITDIDKPQHISVMTDEGLTMRWLWFGTCYLNSPTLVRTETNEACEFFERKDNER
jgi:hypothetical protein